MDWATFFNALTPGINNALSIYSNHQQQKTQNEKSMLTELASDKYDPEVRKLAMDGLMDPGSAGKYLSKIKDMMAVNVAVPPPVPGPPPGPPMGAGAGVTGAAGPVMAPTPGPGPGPVPAGPAEAPPGSPGTAAYAGPAISMRGSLAQPGGSPTQGSPMSVPQLPPPPKIDGQAGAPGAGPAPASTAPPSPGITSPKPAASTTPAPAQGLLGDVSQIPQVLSAVGVERPTAPDRGELRTQAAAEFGSYTPEEIEDPNFIYTNRMVDPTKQRIQADYRQRLQQATTAAMSTWKQEDQQYMQGVIALVSQMGQENRADQRQKASDERQISAQAATDARHRSSMDEATKRQALAAWQQEMRDVEKLRNPTGMADQLALKRDPGMVDKRIAAANERYAAITGQPAPGVGAPGAPGAPAASNRPAPTPTPMPKKASTGGPPAAPVSPQEESRASQLIARMRQQGIQDTDDLPPADAQFLADYYRRKRGI
jgi:hypothetical protein